ncbi:MAG: hypothetical protein TECD_00182 [Hyphomicrobiaceae bacterium hypho_1]
MVLIHIFLGLAMNYDDNNTFAKILRNDLPSERVYEDEYTLAIMDIMPRSNGHVLVLPKTPVRNMLDITPQALCHCITTVKKIGHAVIKAFDADGLTIQQFNETAGGQVVFHLHYHVLPRYNNVELISHVSHVADSLVIKANAEKIRNSLNLVSFENKLMT